jgi:hypothetical protein
MQQFVSRIVTSLNIPFSNVFFDDCQWMDSATVDMYLSKLPGKCLYLLVDYFYRDNEASAPDTSVYAEAGISVPAQRESGGQLLLQSTASTGRRHSTNC